MDTRICEICGKRFYTNYGYSLMVSWVVTGSAYVRAFSCEHPSAIPGNQHWGCCPQHAIEAAVQCINHDEHMSAQQLAGRHPGDKPRYAPNDEWWAKERGENFHILEENRS